MADIIQLKKIRVDIEDLILLLTGDVILPLLTVDILDIEVTKLHKKLMENF